MERYKLHIKWINAEQKNLNIETKNTLYQEKSIAILSASPRSVAKR